MLYYFISLRVTKARGECLNLNLSVESVQTSSVREGNANEGDLRPQSRAERFSFACAYQAVPRTILYLSAQQSWLLVRGQRTFPGMSSKLNHSFFYSTASSLLWNYDAQLKALTISCFSPFSPLLATSHFIPYSRGSLTSSKELGFFKR